MEPQAPGMQALLNDFYGLSDPDTDQDSSFAVSTDDSKLPSAEGSVHEHPPTHIDAETFDPDAYVQQLLDTRPVEQLITLNNDMLNDVRALDSDMQTLVYDNYNKFISATDTIRHMKTQVEATNSQLEQLQYSVHKLTSNSTELETALQPNRSTIAKLTGIRQLLTNLSFLFNLPNRLKESIQLQAYEQTVHDYLLSLEYLKRHLHIPSFKSIYEETQLIIAELKQKLRELVKDKSFPVFTQMDYARLLVSLDEPPQSLWHDVLESRRDYFTDILHTIHETYENRIAEEYHKEFVLPFLQFVRYFRQIFSVSGVEEDLNLQLNRALTSFERSLFSLYFDSMSEKLLNILKVEEKHDADIVVSRLSEEIPLFKQSIMEVVGEIQDYKLQEFMSSVIDDVYTQCVQSCFNTIQLQCMAAICGVAKDIESDFLSSVSCDLKSISTLELMKLRLEFLATLGTSFCQQVAEKCGKRIVSLFSFNLRALDVLFRIDSDDHNLTKLVLTYLSNSVQVLIANLRFGQVLYTGFEKHVHEINTSIASKVSPDLKRVLDWPDICYTSGMLILVFQRISSWMQGSGIEAIFVSVADLVDRNAAKDVKYMARNLQRQIVFLTDDLLGCYVELYAFRIGMLWEKCLLNLSVQDLDGLPDSVQSSVLNMSAELNVMLEELNVFISPEERHSLFPLSGTFVHPKIPRRQGHGINLDIERLFSKEVEIYSEFMLDPVDLLVGVYKGVLKHAVEILRTLTVDEAFFRQLQVDLFALQLCVPGGISQDHRDKLDVLFEEVLSSSLDRCIDDEPSMEAYEIESLCRKSLSNIMQ